MRFIVDAQLPPALARVLAAHGHDSKHVADIGMKEAEDSLPSGITHLRVAR